MCTVDWDFYTASVVQLLAVPSKFTPSPPSTVPTPLFMKTRHQHHNRNQYLKNKTEASLGAYCRELVVRVLCVLQCLIIIVPQRKSYVQVLLNIETFIISKSTILELLLSPQALWSRLLEKLIVTQLVKKFLVFYGTRRFITVFTRARHWSLYHATWIQSTHKIR
jgi:hypothetical protein